MTSLDRVMSAINGSGHQPPVCPPQLDLYFNHVVGEFSPLTVKELIAADLETRLETFSRFSLFFECDWIRTPDNCFGYNRNFDSELVCRFGKEKFIYSKICSPYTTLYGDCANLEEKIIFLRARPEEAKKVIMDSIPGKLAHIQELAKTGIHGIWVGEWLSSADMLSDADYLEFAYPGTEIIVNAIRDAGMVAMCHFCGNMIPRLKYIKELRPHVVGFEEPRKGCPCEIGAVRAEFGEGICLMSNIDVYQVVERGSPDDWVREIRRQINAAGPKRFIIACGSPITPGTLPRRLRDFVRTARQVVGSTGGANTPQPKEEC